MQYNQTFVSKRKVSEKIKFSFNALTPSARMSRYPAIASQNVQNGCRDIWSCSRSKLICPKWLILAL